MEGKLALLLLLVHNIPGGRCQIIFTTTISPEIIYFTEDRCNENYIRDPIGQQECDDYDYGRSNCKLVHPIIEKNINCAYVNIDSLERNINRWRTDIGTDYPIKFKVTNSHIPIWPTSVFRNMQKLSGLSLEELNIKKIMPGAFNHLDSLKELYLAGNELLAISDGVFNSLTQLEKLDLAKNQIQNITNHAFIGGKLQTLLLNNNNISQLEQELVDTLTKLQIFNISNNRLREIRNFSNLPLQKLNFSNNMLNTVDFELLQSVQLEIDLSFNNITELTKFELCVASKLRLSNNNIKELKKNIYIQYLDVSHNQIKAVSKDIFSSELEELYLGSNFISTIEADTFFGLKNLTHLTLDNNNLSSIPNSCFRDLFSLQLLDLSGNKLKYFTYGTFDNLENLQILNISENQLTELQENIFHALSNLKYFYFANNEISNMNADALRHMQYLKVVDLNGNTWSCKKLVDIIHTLKHRSIIIYNGEFWEESNIHGIKCYETPEISMAEGKSDAKLDDSKLIRFYNEDFTKTIMYKYFNKDFKDSNFYKYIESLKNTFNDTQTSNSKLLHDLQMLIKNEIRSKQFSDVDKDNFTTHVIYNYFNKGFNESGFFKYLEDFKNQGVKQNSSENIFETQLGELINLLKNNSEIKSPKLLPNETDMYNYFNKEFKNSNFFKYLENLNSHVFAKQQPENFNYSKTEKLISRDEKTSYITNYTGLLSFIVILLVIIICVQVGSTYLMVIRNKKHRLVTKDDVELVCGH